MDLTEAADLIRSRELRIRPPITHAVGVEDVRVMGQQGRIVDRRRQWRSAWALFGPQPVSDAFKGKATGEVLAKLVARVRAKRERVVVQMRRRRA
mgnify:FL=1